MVQTSKTKLDALIRRVNALIPDSVKPSTRIEIHPCDWIALVNEIDDLQKDRNECLEAFHILFRIFPEPK